MTEQSPLPITLDEAKQLVAHLEAGDNDAARTVLETISTKESIELYAEVGKLTRQLHNALNNFQLDERIADLASEEIPDAQTRLNYVLEETEKAANTTMDAVEASMPLAEQLSEKIEKILPEWKKLMARQLEVGEFKTLCHDLDDILQNASTDSNKLMALLTEVLMAQGYQDLTGQVIRRVIELVKEVEESLVNMLTVFGEPHELVKPEGRSKDKVGAEGPIIDAESRDDVVSGQDDVDDLLSSLGF